MNADADTWTFLQHNEYHKNLKDKNTTKTNRGGTSIILSHLLLVAPPSAWRQHLHRNPVYRLMQDHEQPPPSDPEVWNSEKSKLNSRYCSGYLQPRVIQYFFCSYGDLYKFQVNNHSVFCNVRSMMLQRMLACLFHTFIIIVALGKNQEEKLNQLLSFFATNKNCLSGRRHPVYKHAKHTNKRSASLGERLT